MMPSNTWDVWHSAPGQPTTSRWRRPGQGEHRVVGAVRVCRRCGRGYTSARCTHEVGSGQLRNMKGMACIRRLCMSHPPLVSATLRRLASEAKSAARLTVVARMTTSFSAPCGVCAGVPHIEHRVASAREADEAAIAHLAECSRAGLRRSLPCPGLPASAHLERVHGRHLHHSAVPAAATLADQPVLLVSGPCCTTSSGTAPARFARRTAAAATRIGLLQSAADGADLGPVEADDAYLRRYVAGRLKAVRVGWFGEDAGWHDCKVQICVQGGQRFACDACGRAHLIRRHALGEQCRHHSRDQLGLRCARPYNPARGMVTRTME